MPLFVSDAELQEAGNDISVIVQKADAYIRELQEQLETSKAQGDATAINAEQNCALLEQKYISLSAQFLQLENEKLMLTTSLDKRATELAQVQAQTHKLELGAIHGFMTVMRAGFVLTPDVAIALEKYQDRAAEDVMQKARDMCSASPAKVEEIVAKGDARIGLCDAMKKAGADFLVIGSHGYGTFKRTLLGSVSDYCAHHAKCAVMIIKEPRGNWIVRNFSWKESRSRKMLSEP